MRWREPYELLLLSLSPLLLAELSIECGNGRPIELTSKQAFRDGSIETICRLLLVDVTTGGSSGPSYGEHLACSLAVYLGRRFAHHPFRMPPGTSSLPGAILRRVNDLIEARMHTPLGLADLALEADMSRFHFARMFRNATGESPYQYLIKRRVERAKEMLAQGWSEADVTRATGFSSPGHLASIFRRFTGMTPRKFKALFKA